LRAWKAIRVREDRPIAEDPDAEMMLLDGPAPGTGTAFRWSAVKHISKRFLVAGGLHADNVAAAIRELRPAGVDTCSGVETEPGIKDHSRMAQFIRAARMASSSSSL
ncbi:MAG TPA: phosphoribosylanthranilate isomerase, partial [Bryobacteraceae bacterium]|nr:phosphoribosylanthranilate isomerase [Bryobacteraceae bacterium]